MAPSYDSLLRAHQTELQPGRYPRDEIPAIEELSHTRDRRGLLRRHVSRAADEVAHPLRKVDDYLAALLWHSAVPVLCAGRWNPKNSLPRHLQSAANAPRQPTDGVDPWLGGLRNSGETPGPILLTMLPRSACHRRDQVHPRGLRGRLALILRAWRG